VPLAPPLFIGTVFGSLLEPQPTANSHTDAQAKHRFIAEYSPEQRERGRKVLERSSNDGNWNDWAKQKCTRRSRRAQRAGVQTVRASAATTLGCVRKVSKGARNQRCALGQLAPSTARNAPYHARMRAIRIAREKATRLGRGLRVITLQIERLNL
jgi:hypothetical protein